MGSISMENPRETRVFTCFYHEIGGFPGYFFFHVNHQKWKNQPFLLFSRPLNDPTFIIFGLGGNRLRTVAARQANLLLLDEPTNHLDAEGVRWLVDFINSMLWWARRKMWGYCRATAINVVKTIYNKLPIWEWLIPLIYGDLGDGLLLFYCNHITWGNNHYITKRSQLL